MTRQQLICALEVGRAGSINRAAQNLFMAQPNLSSTIRELEAEIGITLFKRSSQGVEVTHAGEQFLRQAADIVAQFDALESAYHSRDDSVSLSVTTARSSAISDRIARYLNDFAESGVPFRARICEATNMQVIEDVAAGNADIGILKPNYMTADYYLHTAQLRGLTAVKLRPQPYVLLLSGSHPLAGAAHIMPEQLVPYTEVVHDRAVLEVMRGCIRGCRFCQAGYVYRPVRNRIEELCVRYGVEACNDSGYQEVTLSSLSTSDYPPLTDLCDELEPFCDARHVSLSLPSLRADNFSMDLMQRLAKGRKTGLTFAPEAGTQRLRDVINKNVTLEDLLQSCRTAFAGGYSAVKLYFMLGLPTETDEDVLGIADVAARVMHAWRESAQNKQRGVRITVSTSWFVPKPHTAFQWEPQISKAEYERRVALLRDAIKTKTVTYNWHDSDTSFLEAVLARGDRRLGKVLETAWRKGAHLDAWEEYFSLDRWLEAFDACGLDPHFYANRTRSEDELLPWSMISSGVTQDYLKRERHQAYASLTTPDCRTRCNGCGANKLVGGKCDV